MIDSDSVNADDEPVLEIAQAAQEIVEAADEVADRIEESVSEAEAASDIVDDARAELEQNRNWFNEFRAEATGFIGEMREGLEQCRAQMAQIAETMGAQTAASQALISSAQLMSQQLSAHSSPTQGSGPGSQATPTQTETETSQPNMVANEMDQLEPSPVESPVLVQAPPDQRNRALPGQRRIRLV
jgi:capsule polysaccharide export protein KpsE/RkpR